MKKTVVIKRTVVEQELHYFNVLVGGTPGKLPEFRKIDLKEIPIQSRYKMFEDIIGEGNYIILVLDKEAYLAVSKKAVEDSTVDMKSIYYGEYGNYVVFKGESDNPMFKPKEDREVYYPFPKKEVPNVLKRMKAPEVFIDCTL